MSREKSGSMRAVFFDGSLRVAGDYPVPAPRRGWARIRVTKAGICRTDMEIMKGYMGFRGVLGHEFVGLVEACDEASWLGKRVVGDINAACGDCAWCASGMGRHCPERTTLGIDGLDGCMADFCTLPVRNLVEVPEGITDDRAVMTEPLAAACEIVEQVPLAGTERVVVLGDGRLGILCAWVLCTAAPDVTILGHHPEKLQLAGWRTVRTAPDPSEIRPGADIVVEASGSGQGLAEAMRLCRPRGTIVLKSTAAARGELNLAPAVVNELRIQGSRCGQIRDGIGRLLDFPDMPVERLITGRFPIEDAGPAFEQAARRDAVKVLLEINGSS